MSSLTFAPQHPTSSCAPVMALLLLGLTAAHCSFWICRRWARAAAVMWIARRARAISIVGDDELIGLIKIIVTLCGGVDDLVDDIISISTVSGMVHEVRVAMEQLV